MPDDGDSGRAECKMQKARVGCFGLLLFALLLCLGCNQQQNADKSILDAIILSELDNHDRAIEVLNSALKVDKRPSFRATAYSLLGEIYLEMGQYEQSAEAYEQATRLNPLSFNDSFNLGSVYETMGEFAPAAQAYAMACEIDQKHLEAHLNAGKCYYEIKDYDRALIYAQRAEQIGPNNSQIRKLLADIYGSQKDYEKAIAAYKRSLEIDGRNPEIMTSLAVAYLKDGRNELARDVLEEVVRIQPGNSTAHKHLGYCYLTLKDFDKSIENYTRAIQIDDQDWDARRGLGVAYIMKGTDERGTIDQQLKVKAIEQWRWSLEIKPDQPNRESLLKYIRIYSK
jgi:tetratricopeptide (TPR) repeat protein